MIECMPAGCLLAQSRACGAQTDEASCGKANKFCTFEEGLTCQEDGSSKAHVKCVALMESWIGAVKKIGAGKWLHDSFHCAKQEACSMLATTSGPTPSTTERTASSLPQKAEGPTTTMPVTSPAADAKKTASSAIKPQRQDDKSKKGAGALYIGALAFCACAAAGAGLFYMNKKDEKRSKAARDGGGAGPEESDYYDDPHAQEEQAYAEEDHR